MRPTSVLKPLSAVLAVVLFSGCGLQPGAPLVRHTGLVGAREAGIMAKLEAPATAKGVLAYTHTIAQQLDPKARFVMLVGTRIDTDGTPERRGTWTVSYVGSVVDSPDGKPSNPYNRYMRHIQVTVKAGGVAEVKETAELGMPLGLQLLEAPMPALDSQDALKRVRVLDPAPYEGPVSKMVLSAQISAKAGSRLVWRVTTTRQGGNSQVAIDAETGAPISH